MTQGTTPSPLNLSDSAGSPEHHTGTPAGLGVKCIAVCLFVCLFGGSFVVGLGTD